jgi:anti-anti-sigma regulatory factor
MDEGHGLGRSRRCINVDFRHATFIDSAGLGFLAGLARDVAARDGIVRWLSIGERIRRIIRIARSTP